MISDEAVAPFEAITNDCSLRWSWNTQHPCSNRANGCSTLTAILHCDRCQLDICRFVTRARAPRPYVSRLPRRTRSITR